MAGRDGNPLAGSARSEAWDRTLLVLSERGAVDPEAVRSRMDRDVTLAAVREVLAALEDRGWLERPHPDGDVWLPGERTLAVMDLPTRAPSGDGWTGEPKAAAVAEMFA